MFTVSEEDYIRAIYELVDSHGATSSVKVANRLDVSKPSVNRAIQNLVERGYVEHEPYGPVYLTEAGEVEGAKLHKRFLSLRKFLTEILGVDEELAESEAHELEHAVSEETAQAFEDFVEAHEGDVEAEQKAE